MIYRESGEFKTSYGADQAIFPIPMDRWFVLGLIAIAYLVIPFIGSGYWLGSILVPVLILTIAAIGLNILTGYAGQLSLGTGGFMACGAYMAYKITTAFPESESDFRLYRRRLVLCRRWYHLWYSQLANQGFLPRRHHSGGAVFFTVVVYPCTLVCQLQHLRCANGATARSIRIHGFRRHRDPGCSLSLCIEHGYRARAVGKKYGA